MTVYSPIITNRLRYVSDFIGTQLTGKPFFLTDNKKEFTASQMLRINYSQEKDDDATFWLKPYGLLNEKGIHEQIVECFNVNNRKAFFKTTGDFEFDIFSAIFYLLSRYEEYLPHTKDMYGRYGHENSIAYREDFLIIPLINIWLKSFSDKLKEKYGSPLVPGNLNGFSFLPTYDVDEAYSYKYKQRWRTA